MICDYKKCVDRKKYQKGMKLKKVVGFEPKPYTV